MTPACGANRATFMASSWIENSTDQDWLLLKHQIRPDVKITTPNSWLCNLTAIACGGWSLVARQLSTNGGQNTLQVPNLMWVTLKHAFRYE